MIILYHNNNILCIKIYHNKVYFPLFSKNIDKNIMTNFSLTFFFN